MVAKDIRIRTAQAVDKALDTAATKKEFIEALVSEGYKVHWGDHGCKITFTTPDGQKIPHKQLRGLGKYEYAPDALCLRFGLDFFPAYKNGTGEDFMQKRKRIAEFCIQNHILKGQHFLYVLELEDGCYYVGQTFDLLKRMSDHFLSNSAADWTSVHTPVRIFEVRDMGDMSHSACTVYETARTISCMGKYGRSKVRGGDLCSLDDSKIESLLSSYGFYVREEEVYKTDNTSEKYVNALNGLKSFRKIPIDCKE